MPAPLAPQYGVNPSDPYAGPYSTAQQGRQPQSDYRTPRNASLNTASNPASNPASNWYPRSSQVIPNSAEPPVRINDTPSHTVLISLSLHQTDRAPEHRTRALSPRISNEPPPHPGTTHDPRLTTAPAFPDNYPAGQLRSPQNPPPRPHVQIPPTRYSAPDSASPRLAASPATGSHRDIPPAEAYSPRAISPNSNIRVSGSGNQSPPRR